MIVLVRGGAWRSPGRGWRRIPADASRVPTWCGRLRPPSAADYPFGTDNLGRDILSRVILGARGALEVSLLVVGASMAIGVPLGLVAGYGTRWMSEAIMRVTDVFLALPQLVLALALAQATCPRCRSSGERDDR